MIPDSGRIPITAAVFARSADLEGNKDSGISREIRLGLSARKYVEFRRDEGSFSLSIGNFSREM